MTRVDATHLQAMLTGFHSETSGVNGDEVYSMGHTYKPSDMQYWLYNPNISTISVRIQRLVSMANLVLSRTGRYNKVIY